MCASSSKPTQSITSFDIDAIRLNDARQNFLDVNDQRIERTMASLNLQHQQFLEALPLLLHTNHPLLPGYVSNSTPCGISNFDPERNHIKAVKNFAKSFNYVPTREKHLHIHNVSLMGSCGTVAHSAASDMDFWVCYDPILTSAQLSELEQKLRKIEKWAANMGLEVYFFPMDLDQFKSGQRKSVSGEDCGSAQHYLLLDEFYRTSLLIAGKKPLWWMVPVKHERVYSDCIEHLYTHKLIDEDGFCDFGGIPTIPAGEFIGAGMWQLYKGVESPYKSVIKILLTEVYASEYPQVSCLSHIYKEAIYEDRILLNELDPYVMLYRKLEAYLLERNEKQRLELVRRCFYFKVNEPLSKKTTNRTIMWRRELLEELISEWGWEKDEIAILDTRKYWKVSRTITERKGLVNELNHSYRFLSRFARDYKSSIKISQEDMTVLGRKLYAAFERKAGKIELVNPNITKHISEEHLTIVFEGNRSEYNTKNIWVVYSGALRFKDIEEHSPIKRGRSIVELIGWCYFNSILTKDTRITLYAEKSDINTQEIQRIVQMFRQEFPDHLGSAPQDNFHANHQPIRNIQFVNVGIDPLREWNQKGIQKITNQIDALNFGGTHINLIQSIEQITINSWHEIIAAKFDGTEAIIDCILDFMRNLSPKTSTTMPAQKVLCCCPSRPEAISKRLYELFEELISCFYNPNTSNIDKRFLLEVENCFYVFEFIDEKPRAFYLKNHKLLLRHLSKPNKAFSFIIPEKGALLTKDLRTVCQQMKPDFVQVFYHTRSNKKAEIYVVDERGSIQFFTCPRPELRNYLSNLNHFLQSIWYRLESELGQTTNFKKDPVIFYELGAPSREEPASVNVTQPTAFTPKNKANYKVEVVIEDDEKGHTKYTIFCEHQEFSELEHGNQLFHAVATHLLSLRKSKIPYPIYVTDIDLTKCNEEGSVHHQMTKYLQYKLVLENRLNSAANIHR